MPEQASRSSPGVRRPHQQRPANDAAQARSATAQGPRAVAEPASTTPPTTPAPRPQPADAHTAPRRPRCRSDATSQPAGATTPTTTARSRAATASSTANPAAPCRASPATSSSPRRPPCGHAAAHSDQAPDQTVLELHRSSSVPPQPPCAASGTTTPPCAGVEVLNLAGRFPPSPAVPRPGPRGGTPHPLCPICPTAWLVPGGLSVVASLAQTATSCRVVGVEPLVLQVAAAQRPMVSDGCWRGEAEDADGVACQDLLAEEAVPCCGVATFGRGAARLVCCASAVGAAGGAGWHEGWAGWGGARLSCAGHHRCLGTSRYVSIGVLAYPHLSHHT